MEDFKFSPELVNLLRERGHETVEQKAAYLGRVKAVRLNAEGILEGSYDNRREGAAGGY